VAPVTGVRSADGAGAAVAGFDHFDMQRHGPVTLLRINRPDKLNSMAERFWPQLRGLLDVLSGDGETRAVVITGTGDRSFSVGGDIVSFGALDTPAARRKFMTECLETFAAIEDCPVPVIAAVNGWALGGGCELTFACDIVLAAESAVFGMPESAVGLVPGFGVLRAPSVIGRQWTKLMVLAGERLTAQQAREIGMVQRVLPDAELIPAALELGGRIAAQAPLAVGAGKRMVNRGIDRGEIGYSAEALTVLFSTRDAAEGIAAFGEGRTPRFEGR
jgi:enoyl-CoA hydratase